MLERICHISNSISKVRLIVARLSLIIAAVFLVQGCAETNLAAHAFKSMASSDGAQEGHKRFKLGLPYEINGRWYTPRIDMTYNKNGIASWYGPKFHGKYTANGEVYDKHAMTAAHQTLPLPSIVRVTNLENGRSIVVRINDRGPFVGDRIIDLSYRAAKMLKMDKKGLAQVNVQIMPEETLALYERVPRAPTYAQLFPKPAAKPFYVSGTYQPTARPAEVHATSHVSQGSFTPTAVTSTSIAAKSTLGSHETSGASGAFGKQPVFIQAGAFSDRSNADNLKQQLAELAPYEMLSVSPVSKNGRSYYRVRVGPLASDREADQLLATVVSSGHDQARIVID